MKVKKWVAASVAAILIPIIYIACKSAENAELDQLNQLLAAGNILPFFPPLKPGDTPGQVSSTIEPTNDTNANLTIQFSNGTPGLDIACSFSVLNYANLDIILPGYTGLGKLDSNGAATLSFPALQCGWGDASNVNARLELNCSTAQVPSIPVQYLNGPTFIFPCF